MKIVVCVKHVPEGQLHFDPSLMRLDRSGEGTLSKFDLNAVEEGLRLKDEAEAEVVIVSLGPERATESLRDALALGADRAVLVSDAQAAGSDLVATSKALAKAIEREEPDLVLFGQQTSDSGGAILWAGVAECLKLPLVSQATNLRIAERRVEVRRQTEYGYDTIEAPLPAVVAVSDAINEPRYASLKGMMGAKKKPLEVLSLGELGLAADDVGDAGSKTKVIALSKPPLRANAVKFEDDGNSAEAIVDFLLEKQLL